MNLPAVMLFICFSTTYGFHCKIGEKNQTTIEGKTTEKNDVDTKECAPSTDKFCIRVEVVYSGAGSGHGTTYYCDSEQPRLCKDRKEAECYEKSGEESHIKKAIRVCCSSDPEFKNSKSLLSSSSFPTRALLAIIIVLLGPIF